MADLIDRKSAIDVIHKAIFDFFDIVDDDDESPMTYKDEQLLTLNKAIVTKIKALPSADVPDTTFGNMISRQAAIDEAYAVIVDDAVCDVVPVETLEALPSVDAVEVVRCKDCKHRDPEDKKCDSGHDIIWQLPRRDDWYCADGERKDD